MRATFPVRSEDLKTVFENQDENCRVVSSGMWCCVDLALPNISEEHVASIFRVEKSVSREPVSAGGSRLSHQSETTSYIRTGREGE
jgi:hypothetical protein